MVAGVFEHCCKVKEQLPKPEQTESKLIAVQNSDSRVLGS